MAQASSQAQQPATAVETSSPAAPHTTETQANMTSANGATQSEASDPASHQTNAQESLLSISEMLEENATRLRKDEEGKKILFTFANSLNQPGKPPKLVLPTQQRPGTNCWELDNDSLGDWKAYHTKPPTPAGKILSLTHFKSMRIAEAVLLIEWLMQGRFEVEGNRRHVFDIERRNMSIFMCSYINISTATISRCDTYRIQNMQACGRRLPEVDVLLLQYHLVHLIVTPPYLLYGRKADSGITLQRHSGQVQQISHSHPQGAAGAARRLKLQPTLEPVQFVECRLSTSLNLYGKGGEFRLALIGDAGAQVEFDPHKAFEEKQTSSSLRFDPNSLGNLAGLTHFLITLVHLLDAWYEGWKETLNKLDQIVGFEIDHTFDDRQLESHIFDASDSMDLSKQYFTTLQLLRIARQQIENHRIAWEELRDLPDHNWDRLHKSTSSHHRPLSTIDKFVLSEGGEPILKIWEEQRDSVTKHFETKAKHLTERIDQKTKEVESLRDGLFNATSLREAMKGMALNRAIYLFTAVTIIFTPLSFLTALWALPILNTTPEGDSMRPSSNAFLITFIIIPALTYIICGYYAWYLTSTNTWRTFAKFLRRLPRNIYFVWDVCAMYASYPFSESTRETCNDRVQYPPHNMPDWALKAMEWLSTVGKGSSNTESA